MANVSETMVREYFETAGCLVRSPVKYKVVARGKRLDEEADLLVFNPHARDDRGGKSLVWDETDIAHCRRMLVCVRGWHTERLSPAVLRDNPGFFRFAGQAVRGIFEKEMDAGPLRCLLCIPGLPAGRSLRASTEDMLRDQGVDGVLLFPSILLELAARLDTRSNYEGSVLLQVLRILKHYRLLCNPQPDLFAGRGRGGYS